MNRTDRLLAIMLELQARRYTKGADLAERFEVNVRTIYRDVLALCEAGVPVISTPGYGYSIAAGYFLPPLMLTPDEAGGLLLGAAFVAEQVDAPYRQSVETARKKIEKLLPDATRLEVEFLRATLRFTARPRLRDTTAAARLTLLRRAIRQREVLRMRYHARHGEPGTRDVEPHGLVCLDGIWLLAAFCRARQGMRNFRLDRIDGLEPIGERFTRRREFTLQRMRPMEHGPDEVRALFDAEVIRWARENVPLGFIREEEHPAGVMMVFRPRDTRDLLPWLLSWGAGVRVLAPASLRRRLGEIAAEMAGFYAAGDVSSAAEIERIYAMQEVGS